MKRFAVFALALFLIVGACEPAPKVQSLPLTATPQASLATPSPSPGLPVPSLTLPSITEVVERVRPGVVSITTEALYSGIFVQPTPVEEAGSGIIFRPDGYILTNYHVVGGAQRITVNLPESTRFPEGASFEATVVGGDSLSDLAVLKVEAQDLPTIPFGDSSRLRLGEWVIAIGNAQDLPGGPSVTLGIVSALGRSLYLPDKGVTLFDLIQTDAAVNTGNSGGPLLNLAGEVVGINSAIYPEAQNIGFAIASATAVPIRDELVAKGKIAWGWMGVVIQTLTPALAAQAGLSAKNGVLIQDVRQGEPASRAGLRKNDVITSFAGEPTPTVEKLQQALSHYRAGDTVDITFIRDEQTQTVRITLGEMPPRPQ
jgi:serine protease Do